MFPSSASRVCVRCPMAANQLFSSTGVGRHNHCGIISLFNAGTLVPDEQQ